MRSAFRRIRLILLVFSLLLSFGFSVTMIYLRHRSVQNELEHSFQGAALNVIKTAGFNLKVGDLNVLYPTLNAFQQLIAGLVWIDDSTGEPLAVLPPETLEISEDCKARAQMQKISYNGETVGTLWYCAKTEPFQFAVVDGLIAIMFFGLFGLVGIVIYQLFRFALDDTQSMIQILEKVTPENPDVAVFSTNLKFAENNYVIQKIGLLISRVIAATKEADAVKANRRLVDMAASVSHDIRSPVSALRAVSAKLEGVPTEHKHMIERATKRISEIADLLLDKTRLDNSDEASNPVSTELSEAIDEIIAEKKLQYQTRDLELNFDVPNTRLATLVPRVDIQRIISNLINNAVEAVKEGPPKIWIKVFKFSSSNVRVSITDLGVGIPIDVQKNLFSEGYSFGKDKGNGLGLYNAKQTLDRYGGRIRLISNSGSGTIVELDLPLA